jgi:hypothetical protein
MISCFVGAAAVAACGSSTTTGTGASGSSSGTPSSSSGTPGASSSSGGTGGTPGSSSSSSGTANGGSTASTSGSSTSGSSSSSSGAACTGTELTVKNYDAWCTVGVNGGTATEAAEQTVCVQPGTIPLTATANSGFELSASSWHDTDNAGTIANGTDTSSITVTAGESTKCVWVCCPFTGGTGCPTTDQCP